MDKHDTVGLDLVAMAVDDLVVCGAEPLFLQDYIAVGRTVPDRVAEIVTPPGHRLRVIGYAPTERRNLLIRCGPARTGS